ncbi:MAG: SRPBCC family protein [Acidimicrobiales bacterium]|jgi:carbon monoxide dehydrogenase subunit G
MASIRYHARIDRAPDEVWALVSDAGGLEAWFPGVDACRFDGEVRTVSTMGMEIEERVVLCDPELRRFQYSIVGGPMVPEHHLATVDVLEDGDGSLLVYACDVRPDELVPLLAPVYAAATDAVKAHLEGGTA